MGSICASCTIFKDPDVLEESCDIERAPLIMNPDLPDNTRASSIHDHISDPIDHEDIEYDEIKNTPPHLPIDIEPKSNIAQRRAIFETKHKDTKTVKYQTKTKKKYSPKKGIDHSATKAIKPKKKWLVKGIDDTLTNTTKPINTPSYTKKDTIESDDEEPSVSMSHKDRMKLYEEDLVSTQDRQNERMQQFKESRDGYSGIKVSAEQKNMAKKLLLARVERQKKGDMNTDGAVDIVLKSDVNVSETQAGQSKTKKRTLNELLKEATKEDGKNIMNGIGLIQSEFVRTDKCDISILNMNNNNMLSRLSNEEKIKFINLVGHSVVDENGDNLDRLTMCNAGIDDKMMMELMKILMENKDNLRLTELWLESNWIGDEGMRALCRLIECNVESLTVIKLYNNKKDVSTTVCNQLLDALDQNDKIVKFTFEWRLKQQTDRMDKILRKNQELRRRTRLNKA